MSPGLPVISTTEDGLETPEVGEWAEDKGRLFAYYCEEFATAMKGKWERVYIDLFAGAGKVRARETKKVLLGSPLLALAVHDPFDKYVFCERTRKSLEALKRRVSDMHPQADVSFIEGDVNELVPDVFQAMPSLTKGRKVLGFCFADPYKMQDLKFSTLQALARRYMDFLIHVPAMDPTRAWSPYRKSGNRTVDDFLGTSTWRDEWDRTIPKPRPDRFVAKILAQQMKSMGFQQGGFDDAVPVRSTEKNLLLYRLMLFSKHPLGGKFWRQAKKGTSKQGSLF